MPDQIRLLVVEDVPQVAQYVRGLLNSQSAIKLLDVVSDGSRVLPLVGELRPDVVMVDALLQGRVKGMSLVAQIHQSGLKVPVIVLTVPQQPVSDGPRQRRPRRPGHAVHRLRAGHTPPAGQPGRRRSPTTRISRG